MKKRLNKKGFEMSFGVIFSIIIIAVTIFVAVYVIGIFLDRVEQMKFVDNIKKIDYEIDSAAETTQSSKVISLDAPKGTTHLCFANLSKTGINSIMFTDINNLYSNTGNNVFFYPLRIAEKYGTKSAWKILCGDNNNGRDCIFTQTNPLCIRNIDGKFTFRVENPGDYSGKINIKSA